MDLAPDGDIVLVIGTKQVRVRVDSLLLRRTSKVFSAMLAPTFREGLTLKDRHSCESSPMEIPLPDDDPEALTLICAVMQHKVKLIPPSLSATEYYQIARTADKYDCTSMLYFAVTDRSSLFPGDRKDVSDLLKLLAAAYLLRNTKAFGMITKALVLHSAGSLTSLGNGDIGEVVPLQLFCKRFYVPLANTSNLND
jgi:hypothetical protein